MDPVLSRVSGRAGVGARASARRRLARVALASSITALVLLTSSSVRARAASYGACGSSGNNLHGYVDNPTTRQIDEVTGKVTSLKVLHTCTGPGPAASLVLPANLQGGSGTTLHLVQLGYGSFGPSDAPSWAFTRCDAACLGTSAGTLYHPNDLFGRVCANPVLTHAYTFTIRYLASTDDWEYLVRDDTTGTDACDVRSPFGAAYRSGTETWWGFEVDNSWDQYGAAGSAMSVTDLGWQYVNSTATSYVTSAAIRHEGGTKWTCWRDGTTNPGGGGQTTIWAYTLSYGSGGPNSC